MLEFFSTSSFLVLVCIGLIALSLIKAAHMGFIYLGTYLAERDQQLSKTQARGVKIWASTNAVTLLVVSFTLWMGITMLNTTCLGVV